MINVLNALYCTLLYFTLMYPIVLEGRASYSNQKREREIYIGLFQVI